MELPNFEDRIKILKVSGTSFWISLDLRLDESEVESAQCSGDGWG